MYDHTIISHINPGSNCSSRPSQNKCCSFYRHRQYLSVLYSIVVCVLESHITHTIDQDDKKPSSNHRHSPSPRKSSHKSSRSDKHKSHDKDKVDRHRRRSSSRDNDKYDRKKRKHDERDDRKKYRRKRSESRERDDHSSKDRHRDRSNERRKDRYDDRKRYNNRGDGDRRYDNDKRDYSSRREDLNQRNSSRSSNDNRGNSSSSNSSSAISRAEALNRTIERRANEKVQQLQKLGIEIPALLQQQQNLKPQFNPAAQIKPLMSISTSVTGIGAQPTANDESNAETDANLALNLSNFTSPVITNARYTEQLQKKKLIWGSKKATTTTEAPTTNNKWEAAKFSQDSDGKMASKFLRLMGMKNVPTSSNSAGEEDADPGVQKREQMFTSMEQQYEIARQATHTMRGMGLGFGSQSRPY